jgi:hypothetical protein
VRKGSSLHEPLVKTMIMNTLFLKSGTKRIAMTLDTKEMVRVVKELMVMRNDDSVWTGHSDPKEDIMTPWRECERILSKSTLNRTCAKKDKIFGWDEIDPFARLSVFEGTKKIHSVWG